MSDKLINALHDPSFQAKDPTLFAVITQTAMKKGLIRLRSAPNGTVWPCDPSGKIYLGLV